MVSSILRSVPVSLLILAALYTPSALGSEIYGRIHITRRLTRKRVSISNAAYQRGMAVDQNPGQGDDAEMARVAIFLEGGSTVLPLSPFPAAPVKLEQKGRRFEPEVALIPAGASVTFPNLDPIVHNVFSLSKPKSFDLGYYRQGQSRSVRFDRPGIVSVYCHLHPNMSAAVVVAPGPWLVQPDLSGAFRLTGIDPGKYTLVIWHKSAGFFRRGVAIEPGSRLIADVEIPIRDSHTAETRPPR
ncbi:MAG: hypothetical protein R2762_01685 [Bryobacteraceae bacterium]